MNILDISIIAFFLLSICLFGLYQSYNNKSQSDFFLAGKNINWVTAMFSIVATETSVLTFISIPAIAYIITLRSMTRDTNTFIYVIIQF